MQLTIPSVAIPRLGHWLFAGFVSYALLSLLWCPSIGNAREGLVLLAVFGVCYALGAWLPDLKLAMVFAFFATVLAGVFGRFYGYLEVSTLFALICVGLICARLWLLAVPSALFVAAMPSRGAWLVVAFGLLANFVRKPLILLVLVLCAALYFLNYLDSHNAERLWIWKMALDRLTVFGNGISSFWSVWFTSPETGRLKQPQFVHNDFIQFVFEYGIGSVFIFALLAKALVKTSADEWPLLAAFLFLATFMFPFQIPSTLAIGAVTLGRLNRSQE